MNTTDGALDFKAFIDNTWLYRSAAETENRIRGITKAVETESKKMTNSFGGIDKGMALIGGTAALGFLGKQIIETTAKFEKFGIVLRNSLGEVRGTQALEMIAEFTAATPFQLDEVTDSFIRMANQGFVPTRDEMVKLGDLASSTGKGFNQLSEAILDAQSGEFERLKEFGIKASSNGDQVTFSFREQETTVAKTNSAIRDYILSLGELNGIQGANALISESMTGQISNLQDKFAAMFNEIGQSNSGIIYTGLELAADLVENYETVGKVILGLVGVYGAYKAAVMVTNAVSILQREIAYQQILANIGNTGSTITLTTAEGLAAVAKSRLTQAQLALNASILANPYVAVAAAVVALSAAVYFLATRTTEAQKAQKELNGAIESETLTLDIMFSRLKNATKGTDEYRLAKQAIIDKYGQYDTMLEQELDSVDGLKTAYEKLTTAVIESTKSRLRDKYTTEAANETGEAIAKLYGKFRDHLVDELGDQAGSALFASVKGAFESGGDWQKVLSDAGVDPSRMYGAWGEDLSFTFAKISAEKNKLSKSLKEFDDIFGETGAKATEEGKKVEEAIVKNREYWEKQREGAKKVLDAMPGTEKGSQAWDAQLALIKEAELALEAWDLKAEAKADKKGNDEAEKARKEYEEAKLDAIKKANEEEVSLKRSLITDKKALIDFDLKQELAGINAMEELYKKKASAAGIKNPDTSMFTSMRTTATSQANADKKNIDTESYNKLLSEYRSFEQKKKAISDEYDKKRIEAQANNNAELVTRLNEAEAKALSALATEELTGSSTWSNLFGNLDEMAARDIETLIQQIEAQFESLSVEFDPVDLAAIRTKLEQAKAVLIADNPFKQVGVAISNIFSDGAKDAKKSASDIKRDWKQLGQATEESFKFVTDAIDSADFLKEAIGEVGTTAISSLESVSVTAIGVASAIKTAEKGTVILAIIQAALIAVQAVMSVIDAFGGNHDKKLDASIKRHQENVKNLQVSYDELDRSIERALGEGKYQDHLKQIDLLKQQREEYKQMIQDEAAKKETDEGKISEYKDQIRAVENAIEDIVYKIRDEIMGGTARDIATELGDAMYEAFAAGEDAAQAWGDKVNEVVGDVVKKMLMQKLIEQPVGEIINKYAQQWMAYDDTQLNALKQEHNKLKEKIESGDGRYRLSLESRKDLSNLAKLQEQIDAELAKQTSVGFAGIDTVLAGADKMGAELSALGEGLSATMEGLPDSIKKYVFGDNEEATSKALSGSIQSVTEETAGILSGQINAMRIIQLESQELIRQQIGSLTEIASNTRFLKSIDSRLASMGNKDSLRSQGL